MDKASITINEFRKLKNPEDRAEGYALLSDHDRFLARITEPMKPMDVICNSCSHYRGFGECDAYPDGIRGSHISKVEEDLTVECGDGFRYEKAKIRWSHRKDKH